MVNILIRHHGKCRGLHENILTNFLNKAILYVSQ